MSTDRGWLLDSLVNTPVDVFEPYWKTWVCCLALVPDSSFLTMHTPRGHSHGRLGLNHGAKGKLFSAGTAKLKVDIGGEI